MTDSDRPTFRDLMNLQEKTYTKISNVETDLSNLKSDISALKVKVSYISGGIALVVSAVISLLLKYLA